MATASTERRKIFLKDYKAPNYWVREVELDVALFPEEAFVTATYQIERNSNAAEGTPLELDGENMELLSAEVDGVSVDPKVTKTGLTLESPPKNLTLKTKVRLLPQENKSMEGLYKSGDIYCTQCEAEGFRKISYFVDRPDNMALFTTRISADKGQFPYLLSNGNLVESGDLEDGRHFAVWKDPFKKPSYLFALVAGDFDLKEDTFITRSNRKIDLKVFVDKGRKDRTQHTIDSLKRSMKWDEERYGLEYDLDNFMIVAVDDFNMGAMENKGLNIFNSRAALANPATATDGDYENVDAIIAHEYFHNWTGNRVTCRDWFQLSLKEGLTVYRDQEYTSDHYSPAVKRIDDVQSLRLSQFDEDAGPNAHPVRPAYCYSVDNFYTSTIYEKGAELIRMIEVMVGRDGFRKGLDKYFELYDGQAVTTEDFVYAMETANNIDLTQFKLWYNQSGTPVVKARGVYDPSAKTYSLTLQQSCPPTPEQPVKENFHIPVRVGLIDKNGNETADKVLHLKETSQTFTFEGVKDKPYVSMLRNFSAPVRIEMDQSDEELAHLIQHDGVGFNRWEAAQNLFLKYMIKEVETYKGEDNVSVSNQLMKTYKHSLETAASDPLFSSRLLGLPSTFYVNQFLKTIDPDAVYKVRERFRKTLATANKDTFKSLYDQMTTRAPYSAAPEEIAKRYLKSACLHSLCATGNEEYLQLAHDQYFNADNMTDKMAALQAILDQMCPQREEMMSHFFEEWKGDRMVLNKYFGLESSATRSDILNVIQKLMETPQFDKFNPNNIYSTVARFAHANPVGFHMNDGKGYNFVADQVIDIDKRNPQVAARVVTAFDMWKRYDERRQGLMKQQLERIVSTKGLSKNTYELTSNALKS